MSGFVLLGSPEPPGGCLLLASVLGPGVLLNGDFLALEVPLNR